VSEVSTEEKNAIPHIPDRWLVASSPHVHAGETVSQIMWTVCLALLPACVAGLVVFGWRAGLVLAIGVLAAMLSEAVIQRVLHRPVAVSDGSAAVTGLLLAMCLPPDVAWYVPVVGSFVAILIGKQVFGGLGRNYFNPALIGRAFLQFAFPAQISRSAWPILMRGGDLGGAFTGDIAATTNGVDVTSMATPLAVAKAGAAAGPAFSPLADVANALQLRGDGAEAAADAIRDMVLGNIPGCIGEVSKLALLLGGAILIANRYVNWRLPLAYIATAVLAGALLPVQVAPPDGGGAAWLGVWGGNFQQAGQLGLVHLLGGGLFLGGFFMITDMVTSPVTSRGQVAYGILGGLLVALIRVYGAYPEGVCYSILLVNSARLFFEKYTMPRVFGTGRR
jgi:electron transport complex protein RnfD